jgi:hypothetical protein
MTPDAIIDAIHKALGDPDSGAIADAMPLIDGAVRSSFGGKETRIVKAAETR